MANQRNSNQRRPAQSRSSRQSGTNRRNSPSRSRKQPPKQSGIDWYALLLKFRARNEFKPDSEGIDIWKMLHLTQMQRNTLLRWGLYTATIVLLLVIQDIIMSQISIFGATTDLAVCAILLVTVIEGVDVGSLFVAIASCLYYFSGSSPGPYTIILLTVFGIAACLFRQLFWHRNAGSIVLCAGLALMLYELSTFLVGLLSGLTRMDCLMDFVVTGGLSIAVMIPLYSLFNRIGQIGGHTWKE